MARIVITEDDKLTARTLSHYCREAFEDEPSVIKEFDALTPALYYIRENPIDLLILDINLRGESGFNILDYPEKDAFYTIVTSSDPRNAVNAFDYGVLDFVAKPFTRERFMAAIARMREARGGRERSRKSISIKKDGILELIKYADILFMQSEGNFTDIHLKDGRLERIRRTLDAMEADLDENFFRSHRSCVVNLREVIRIMRGPNNTWKIALSNSKEVALSRSRHGDLKKILLDLPD